MCRIRQVNFSNSTNKIEIKAIQGNKTLLSVSDFFQKIDGILSRLHQSTHSGRSIQSAGWVA
jgi:hypothetical protein